MRRLKFTETLIVSILKVADACRPVNEIWWGCNTATYSKWKASMAGWRRRISSG